ncbi:MAG: anti-sigma factor family protein, partial [Candidatus Angelobacter sp.]
MNCSQAKALFSPYLDGMISGAQMHALSLHLGNCAQCHDEYQLLRDTQRLLATTGRRKAPEDLGLKLRLAISREVARSRQRALSGIRIRFENTAKAFM